MTTNYATSTGRSITEIAAHASKYAAGRDDAGAASAVISVALTQVVGPLSPGNIYSASLNLTRDLMNGRSAGASQAQWSIDNFAPTSSHRAEHAARVRAIADVIEASEVRLDALELAVTELRAFANIYDPTQEI